MFIDLSDILKIKEGDFVEIKSSKESFNCKIVDVFLFYDEITNKVKEASINLLDDAKSFYFTFSFRKK